MNWDTDSTLKEFTASRAEQEVCMGSMSSMVCGEQEVECGGAKSTARHGDIKGDVMAGKTPERMLGNRTRLCCFHTNISPGSQEKAH